MRILVTGGAGRLGTGVCSQLAQNGHQVWMLTRRNPKRTQCTDKKIQVCRGDITRPDTISRILDNTDIVVHMAAILPPQAHKRPALAEEVNVGGTKCLVSLIKQKPKEIPIIYTSSVAVFGPTPDAAEPLSAEKDQPQPRDSYGRTKLEAENIIKQSGLDFSILRLTAAPYLAFRVRDLKQMFSIPLTNRVEFCHPGSVALAISNAVENFNTINGKTLIISGGAGQRMLFKEMVGRIFRVVGLPLPGNAKFARQAYCLDWYDTGEAERLLRFQNLTFDDYLADFREQLNRRYGNLFVPIMRRVIGPVFGKAISRIL